MTYLYILTATFLSDRKLVGRNDSHIFCARPCHFSLPCWRHGSPGNHVHLHRRRHAQKCKYRVATGLAEKNSLTFPWHFPDCKHKFQSLLWHIPYGNFCDIFKTTMKSHYSLTDASTYWSWKYVSTREHFQHHENCQYLVPNIMQNMKTNKVYKKIFGKWYLNENLI